MADHQDNTSMYCHACHRVWKREGDSIECPQCCSSSTEMVRNDPNPDTEYQDDLDYEEVEVTITTWILTDDDQITAEHDPRLFHNRPQEQPVITTTDSTPMETTPTDTTPAPMEATPNAMDTTPTRADATPTSMDTDTSIPDSTQTTAEDQGSEETTGNSNRSPPRSQSIHFTAVSFPTGVTLITTVVGDQPPSQFMPGPIPIPFFGWHFMQPPRRESSSAQSNGDSHQAENHNAAEQQQQQQQQEAAEQAPSEEQRSEPQHGATDSEPRPAAGPQPPRQAQMLEALLAMLFNPAAAVMGDAVYSQEAFDRVMTQLRNQMPVGGAPPASKDAIEKLEVKELDEQILGTDGCSKCVVCVEDMVQGEKATFLPCNHFFHGECVTPWLKEHNTCPVCRRSIEQEETLKSKIVEFGPERPPEMRQHESQDNSMDCS
ncbi:hypothetical protein QBC43DRAFT_314367 [Cladorrhinum sp. PSN259]|nr:hypothetical protein QBC43DRAFT_314367 [Cladorrhinum sp. PSN259]